MKGYLSRYEKIMNVVDTNPIFPVTMQEYSDIINAVIELEASYSAIARKVMDKSALVSSEEQKVSEENTKTLRRFKKNYNQILSSTYASNGPTKLRELRDFNLNLTAIKQEKVKDCYCGVFHYFEVLVPQIVSILSKIDKIAEKTGSNKQRLESAEEWYNNERVYLTIVFLLNEKMKTIDMLTKVPTREGGLFASTLKSFAIL
ncbi:hypothetical protein EIN_508700 [Entamoeba invadens IP1]|uniref:Uncharacterized protein n=1 Tax=Entamoeba invadens IP1 TaxID=370355 RepID=A0A0A1UGN5_ENTIV|nr:hypothetical protein EIN_508700 [Entamoeba invadens IP1]ELP92869.1 hypothetical protein EIN_508700 [Entamoeba invadens IP1]|eukprot:XP_004259640.1 hypothetical protein EIN_508700 [Entamoeba invadens IP1]